MPTTLSLVKDVEGGVLVRKNAWYGTDAIKSQNYSAFLPLPDKTEKRPYERTAG